LVEAYTQLAARGESVLVVSQTRAEVRELNEAIRERLRANGALSGPERIVQSLEPIDLTAAQKADARFHPPDAVARLRRSGTKRGGDACGKIVAFTPSGVVLEVTGKLRMVRRANFDRLSIHRPRELAVSAGDQLQIKANAVCADGRKLANGEIVAVAAVENG